ncbi:MAG TPA: alpha/beta-hydrolase family protein [Streptosporangiaceae bacterium]|nr:alpha/beta-hydrolase family protein [Streptosporangiaceae bacterium]
MDEVASVMDLEERAADMPGPPAGRLGEHPGGVGQGAARPVGAGQPPGAAGISPAVAAAEASRPPAGPGKLRKLFYVTLPGCWGALIVGCLSFTPSLLPRDGIVQGLVWGITAAIGYGLGVLAAWIWRAFAGRDARHPRRRSRPAFVISAAVLVVVFFGLGQYWQYEIRKLMGVTDYNIAFVVVSPLIAALIFCLILLIGRGLRGLYRWAVQLLHRWVGQRAARAVAWVLVAGLAYLVVTGLLFNGFVNVANAAFSVRNTTTPAGVYQPMTSLRSGGPDSLVPWATLGRQGRSFIGSGPSAADIKKFTHHPAMEPIRAYAGLASAADVGSRAALAVQDLQREGGFQRKNLLVVTTTGSGWVDPALADSFEYLSSGDSAIVAIQYSYLPSWISYLVDQSKAREAGAALFDAVYGRWSQLPPGQRPRLFVAGESLGSFGGEAAFSGEYGLSLTAGTLFAGPPNFNTLFREFSDHRDPGSPEVQPVFQDGRIVRFADDPSTGIPPVGQPWQGSRVLYMMHPSDPVVWWSPHLIFSEPSWISQPPGQDVLAGMFWMPLVTFWQVTADLPFSADVPAGHGHHYTAEYVDGWNAVMRPSGVTSQDLAHLRKIIAAGG